MRGEDLTGRRFGRLVVLGKAGAGRVKVRCDCGCEKVVLSSNLKQGFTTSCGCSRKGKWQSHIKTTVGQRFGMLVVKEELGGGRVLCHCDCGNDKEVNKGHLLHGEITSCGCLLKKQASLNRAPYYKDDTYLSYIKNSAPTSRSTSGVRGVYWIKSKNKWRASIGFQGQKIDLGYFDTKEAAAVARKQAEEKYYQPILDKWKGVPLREEEDNDETQRSPQAGTRQAKR